MKIQMFVFWIALISLVAILVFFYWQPEARQVSQGHEKEDVMGVNADAAESGRLIAGGTLEESEKAINGTERAMLLQKAPPVPEKGDGDLSVYVLIAVLAAVVVGLGLFTITLRNEEYTGDTFKVLSSDTRIGILKSLQSDYFGDKKKTLSRLAQEQEIRMPTAKEHMDKLIEAGLVKKDEETGKKLKYYSLTDLGKRMIKQTKET